MQAPGSASLTHRGADTDRPPSCSPPRELGASPWASGLCAHLHDRPYSVAAMEPQPARR